MLKKLVDGAAAATMRRYLSSRINLNCKDYNELKERVQQFIETLNGMKETELWKYANEKERKLARKFLSKYPEVLDYLTVDNVLRWLAMDVPIAYGIIVAHPNGIKWLKTVLDNLKNDIVNDLLSVEVLS